MSFLIHPRLEEDTILLGELDLCEVRLIPDSDNPWIVLVPKREDIREIHELTDVEQGTLIYEISKISQVLSELFSPEKINVGALGNMVPQLHIHIICRFIEDRAWPNAIWGTQCGEDQEKIDDIIDKISNQLW